MTTTLTATRTGMLLCAATRWESAPVAKRLGLSLSAEGRYEGIVGGRPVILLKTGMGKDNTLRALSLLNETPAHQALSRLACVISIGYAGALQENIRSGDLVCDLAGCDASWVAAARDAALDLRLPLHFGRIVNSEKVLACPKDKSALGQKLRACAVDMESSAIRQWALKNGADALTIRTIFDSLSDQLPPELPASEDAVATLRYALRNPASVPALLRLGFKTRNAVSNLALFLERLIPKL